MEAALSLTELTKIRTILSRAFQSSTVNELGRATGQARRLRTVTPHRLFLAVVSGLAAARIETLADLLRVFNHQHGVRVAYKAFYNRLAGPGFETFMRTMCARLLAEFRLQTLTPDGEHAVGQFRDIVIQDGSSFAVNRALHDVFPGRFTTIEPAAVEIHATYSGYSDEVIALHLAPDAEAERQFLPAPATLRDCLLLADRGYPSVEYFAAVRDAGGAFIVRLSTSHDPYVLAAWQQGRRLAVPTGIRLSRFLAQHPRAVLDLDIEYRRQGQRQAFRLVVVPSRGDHDSRLCTNLPRRSFSAVLVGRLYRFRWQIELCFKEWKSYANLHKFDTANPHIAAGLIWAGLCAALLKRFLAHAAQRVGGAAVSTRRVAMCAHLLLGPLVQALLRGRRLLAALRHIVKYLLANARRSNVPREQQLGRLRAGLLLFGAA
jgi:hypothetical protein